VASALLVMAKNDGMAAKGSTRKKMELSASNEKRTMGAWLSSFRASAAELERSTLQARTFRSELPVSAMKLRSDEEAAPVPGAAAVHSED